MVKHPNDESGRSGAGTMLRARWVVPVSSAPIEYGAVLIRDGRLAAVGKASDFDAERVGEARDLGDAALMPGLVNTHSHLELTVMRGLLEDADFRAWITRLTEIKMVRMTADDLLDSARLGALEAVRHGVTCCGDTCDSGFALDALVEAGLRGIVYQETFGPDAAQAAASLDDLKQKVGRLGERVDTEGRVRVGVSPHAPYTVSAELFRAVTGYALEHGLPVAIHTAESDAEQQFVTRGAGPFFERLAARGIEWPVPGVSTIRYFADIGVLETRPLLVHCVQADEADLDTVAATGSRIAHCPKSNAKFGHGTAGLADMVRRGIAVGIGTDSVASNNICDILDEARIATLFSRARECEASAVTARTTLELATLGGAKALGLDGEIGSLDVGKRADLCAVKLDGVHTLPVYDVETALAFSCSGRDVSLTMVGGRVVFDSADAEQTRFDEVRLQARIREIVKRIAV